ncbi:MAG: tetratricopeptide repeat protein [Gemmatimonadetes bacterium]|nr:tetratricopeptide repeat protein [Gemmatimonadota bacterium]
MRRAGRGGGATRRARHVLALSWAAAIVTAASALVAPLSAQDPSAARAALRSGEYEDAIDEYRGALRADPSLADARIGLIQALLATGEYEDAITAGREAPSSAPVANALGEALLRVGRLEEAEAAFSESMRSGGPWSLVAEVNLAELAFMTGRIGDAMGGFDRLIDAYNAVNGRMAARDLVAVGRAVAYLGRDDPNLFQDALRAFDEAAAADPGWHEPKVRAGMLFLDKYDSPAAQEEFHAVLAENPRDVGALLGMAKAMEFDGQQDARPTIDQLLEVDPRNVEARILLAMRFVTNERYEEARAEAERALEVNPRSLPALTALAGSYMLAEDSTNFVQTRERALAINSSNAEMEATLAELAVQTRRYPEAVVRANEGIRLDPSSWESWGLRGMNRLRLGDIGGRADVERAFEGDPYNPWFKNTLDLLDTFERYTSHETEHFNLFLHGTEDELLATYVAPIVEEAYDSLSRRYGIQLPGKTRAEFFISHADFSVRTLGEAGLGALGVSFGPLLVMDSPAARTQGEYNWASVFWHELSHSFHLALTNGRVPRWFSEGLSVHEQRRGRPWWGHTPNIPFLQALAGGRLKPVSELNDGFMRPDYPEQVIFSYYQASLVFGVIEERWGFQAIRAFLDGYARGETTEALFESVLDMPISDFDDLFDDYLRERFESPLAALVELGRPPGPTAGVPDLEDWVEAHPGDLIGRLRLGALLLRDRRFDDAEVQLREALRMFPEYGEADSPYWYLAQIHRERGELDRAAAALARLNALSESNYQALVMEAEVLEELGRPAEAVTALDKAVQVWPYEIELHERLATLAASVGDHQKAARERSAVVALAPTDRAQAHYLLAVAQRDAGDAAGARRSVLRSLEIAPNYDSALELLLELRGAGGPG